jgi:hypothetical protein
MNKIYRIVVVFFLTVLLGISYAAKKEEIFHRSYWQPYYHGQRLNYCTLDGNECGLAVATQYCKMMGYLHADHQIIANNVGLTNYILTPAHCSGWRCNGFKTIRCVGKMSHIPPKSYYYRLRRFVFPRYNHYRIDWCYDGTHYCGKRSALSFCRRMGYMQARSFTIQKHVAATQAIGNQKLCFGQHCDAFSEITCYR